MAEGFELYHIPQQTRREKLRIVGDLQGCAGLGLLPFRDQPSFISSSQNLLSCAQVMASDSSYNSGSYATDSGNDHCQDLSFIQRHDQTAPFHGGDFVALSLSSQNGNPPVGLNLRSYGGDFRRSTAEMTIGPYTGYASILRGSRFLKPAKQLLDEICDVGLIDDPPPLENLRAYVDDPGSCGVDKRKRSTLIYLLDEVYKMYKQYYKQIQAVITSFGNVAGLSNAAPFANLDIKAMSKHFHLLNNAIIEQLHFSAKPHKHQISYGNKDFILSASSEKGLYGQLGFVDHQPVWRPQRGLPKQAVTVLRSWLFDHFLHPYPTDSDKQLLAKQTGLSRNQVSNWFINARVRLWKPMVEEVHTLETRQAHKMSLDIHQQETSPLGNSFLSRIVNQGPPPKRTRNEFPSDNKYKDQHIMERSNKEHMNFYDNLSIHTGNNHATLNHGLPLTLGLRQNNNIFTISESFPLNVDGGEIIGGRFLHDFGG